MYSTNPTDDMTRILYWLLLLPFCAAAQKMPDAGLDKVRIVLADKIIVAELVRDEPSPRIRTNLFYYWYSANTIHASQGGFSGELLNGLYTEYYADRNLKQQGTFKNGLKDGLWKLWKEDGTLSGQSRWKNGVQQADQPVSFWQKINVLKKSTTAKSVAADTTKK